MKELTRDEFNYLASKNNWEVFSEREVYQFSQSILKSMDPIEKEHGAIDFVSLTRQEVRNNNLSKSVVYWRESQVEWEKAPNGELMKARSGIYKDTSVNRKKGLVGQRYGAEKKEKAPETKDKPDIGKILDQAKEFGKKSSGSAPYQDKAFMEFLDKNSTSDTAKTKITNAYNEGKKEGGSSKEDSSKMKSKVER